MSEEIVSVGIGEIKIGRPPLVLQAVALGSCVGIAIYDSAVKVGGLAHIMLPNSPKNPPMDSNSQGKFADIAIPFLVEELVKNGASRSRLIAKIVGGSKMFEFNNSTAVSDIGSRNVQAIKNILQELSIPIVGEETGGNYGRTMVFDLKTGSVEVISLTQKIRKII